MSYPQNSRNNEGAPSPVVSQPTPFGAQVDSSCGSQQFDLERKSTPDTYNDAITLLMYFAEGVRQVTRKLKRRSSLLAVDGHECCDPESLSHYLDTEEDVYGVLTGTVFGSDLGALDDAVNQLNNRVIKAVTDVAKAVDASKVAQQEAAESLQAAQDAFDKALEIRQEAEFEADSYKKKNEELRAQIEQLSIEKKQLLEQMEYLRTKAAVAKRQSKRRLLEQHIMEAMVVHERQLLLAKHRETSRNGCTKDNVDIGEDIFDDARHPKCDIISNTNGLSLSGLEEEKQSVDQTSLDSAALEEANHGPEYKKRAIQVPKGRLGILIKDIEDGPTICSIDAGSSVKDILVVGDIVKAVDDVDVSHLGAFDIVDILTQKSESAERVITVLRPDVAVNTAKATTSWMSPQKIKSSIRKIGGDVTDALQASSAPRIRDELLGLGGLGGVQALDLCEQHDSPTRSQPSGVLGGSGRGTLSLFAATLEACKEIKREALLNLDEPAGDYISDSDASTCSFTSLSTLSERDHEHRSSRVRLGNLLLANNPFQFKDASEFDAPQRCKSQQCEESSLEPEMFRTLSYSSDEE